MFFVQREAGLMEIVRSLNRSWICDTSFGLYRAFHPGEKSGGKCPDTPKTVIRHPRFQLHCNIFYKYMYMYNNVCFHAGLPQSLYPLVLMCVPCWTEWTPTELVYPLA